MNTGFTAQQLIAETQKQELAKADYIVSAADIRLTSPSVLNFGDLLPLKATPHTSRQIENWAKIPAQYRNHMMAKAPELYIANVNHWLKNGGDCRRMIRTLDGTARAFLSDRYKRLDNSLVLSLLSPVLREAKCQIASCYLGDRMYIKAVSPKQTEVKAGDVVQWGLSIQNGEIGNGALSIQLFSYRLICSNGMVFKDSGLRKCHIGRRGAESVDHLLSRETLDAREKALGLAIRDTAAYLLSQENISAMTNRLKATTTGRQIERPAKTVEKLGKATALTAEEQENLLIGLVQGGDFSQFGTSQAITALANSAEDYERSHHLETTGGQIINLNKSEWERLALTD